MTLQEIKTKICDLRCTCEELQEESHKLWEETDNEHVENLADMFDCELGYIAYRLGELEDAELDMNEEDTESLDDWFYDLDTTDKERLSGIAYIIEEDRGDSFFDWKDRIGKWWNAKTCEQKREIYSNYNLGY